jgi:hypothetical protein
MHPASIYIDTLLCDPNIGTIYPIQSLYKMPHNSGAMAEQLPYQCFGKLSRGSAD